MFCEYCGAKIEDDSKFCPMCGKRLDPLSPEQASISPIKTTSSNTKKPSNATIYLIVIIAAIVVGFILFGALAALNTIPDEQPTANQGTLYVTSYPSGATVKLGGKDVGVTPCTLYLNPDTYYALHVVMPGYETWYQSVWIGASKTKRVTANLVKTSSAPTQTPQPINEYGTLYITSNPSGATVKLGGKDIGVTPLTATVISNTNYMILLSKPGYEAWYRTVSVGAGRTETISATLTSTYNPQPTPTVTQTQAPAITNQYYDREYTWSYGGKSYTMTMSFSKAEYNYYRSLGHTNLDMSIYASEKRNREIVKTIADEIIRVGNSLGYTQDENVLMAVSFVQALPYTSDEVTKGADEYVRYPIETLVDNGGDCEDSAILTAAIIREMGYGAVILLFSDHAAVGVKGDTSIEGTYWELLGERYYYLETTYANWDVGEIPDEYRGKNAIPIPIL